MTALAFGGGVATAVVLLGTRDLESYEHAFFSLDRGTAVHAIDVLGQPVYTLGIGLGVRLPLHGSLAASPAARVARYLPDPITYWLLLTLSIAAAVLIVRHALQPLCGALVSWIATALLFYSVPVVAYTISNDWPETTVTYCAIVVCVFAPHALLALSECARSGRARRLAWLSVTAVLWAAVALSHAGYWALMAIAFGTALAIVLCRTDHPARARFAVVIALAGAALVPVALQAPDILRELVVAGDAPEMTRRVDPTPGGVVEANLFPLTPVTPAHDRMPFGFLLLALVSLVVGVTAMRGPQRRLIVVSAVASILISGATNAPPGAGAYAPSSIWSLRDVAGAFAILAAACAAGTRRTLIGAHPVLTAAMILAALQGPVYATSLVWTALAVPGAPWMHDTAPPDVRVSRRGLAVDRVSPGRLAMWPDVRIGMRKAKRASTDFSDAGYVLVTAWTKQRTMRGLVEPNPYFFNQQIDLSPEILCDDNAVRFLQLRYLLRPSAIGACQPWAPLRGLLVDGWLEVDAAAELDNRVRGVALVHLTGTVRASPALSPGSALLPLLTPLPGTSLSITSRDIVVTLDNPSVATGHALVLPVAYDAAWRASFGDTRNTGGLLTLVGIDQSQVRVMFVPDSVAALRAGGSAVAQMLAIVGLLGLVMVGRPEA